MTRRTLFAGLIGAPLAAASVQAITDAPKAASQLSTYWEGERFPILCCANGNVVSTVKRFRWAAGIEIRQLERI